MKLMEIFSDRGADVRWHYDKIGSATSQKPNPLQLQKAGLIQDGVWLLSPEGKRLAGPFPDMQTASRFKENRPDRIPADAVARRVS